MKTIKISIVIPAFNEEKAVYTTLEDLFTRHAPDEVLVVDGGSMDKTGQIAGEWTRVISGVKGRAEQLNEGARQATGDILLFLYPGTTLPSKAFLKIKDAVREGAKAGRFSMRFADRKWILSFYSQFTKFTFFSCGDQGFFVRKEIFEQLGGFREDIPFEDMEFYRRLCGLTRPLILQDAVMPSSVRYNNLSLFRQNLLQLFLHGLSSLGLHLFKAKKKSYPHLI